MANNINRSGNPTSRMNERLRKEKAVFVTVQRIIFLILAAGCITVTKAQSTNPWMKFLSYNVLHGFSGDTARESNYVEWVSKINPDVIAYQELNGFTQDSLEKLAKRYGHLYAAINTGVTHPIGITSRYPIVMVQHVTENMWHSYLYGIVNGVHVFVTHLSPFDVNSRRADLDIVLAHTALLPADEKIIVMGDFNSLASIDSAQYGENLLAAMRKSEGRLEPKSGLPIVEGKTIYRHNLDNGRIDYTVTNKMLAAGFRDAYYLTNKKFKASAPTEGYRNKNSKLKRIDYIWVNGAMAATVRAADIIDDSQTKNLSDHYPVFINCQF